MNVTLTLETTAYTKDQLPGLQMTQVALAGRSNVGKSSLLNRLANRKNLARTSASPGKTRSINFYRVTPHNFFLVDLPGYGYARCSKKERDMWARLVHDYFTDNPWLQGVVVLLDCRLTPQANDLELLAYLQNLGLPIIPVLIKADKCKQRDRTRASQTWRDILKHERPPLLVSAKTGMNRDKLWQTLIAAAGSEPPLPGDPHTAAG